MSGDETQNAGHSVLYREVSMVTAVLAESGQPASLEQAWVPPVITRPPLPGLSPLGQMFTCFQVSRLLLHTLNSS